MNFYAILPRALVINISHQADTIPTIVKQLFIFVPKKVAILLINPEKNPDFANLDISIPVHDIEYSLVLYVLYSSFEILSFEPFFNSL